MFAPTSIKDYAFVYYIAIDNLLAGKALEGKLNLETKETLEEALFLLTKPHKKCSVKAVSLARDLLCNPEMKRLMISIFVDDRYNNDDLHKLTGYLVTYDPIPEGVIY